MCVTDRHDMTLAVKVELNPNTTTMTISRYRYLQEFLKIRETVPQAHKLMGQICEALHDKKTALDSYKRLDSYQEPSRCQLPLLQETTPSSMAASQIKYYTTTVMWQLKDFKIHIL